MKSKTLISLIFSFISLAAFAADQSNYNQAWAAFNANNRAEARKQFTLAAAEPASKADALLSLCLLDWNEGKEADAFAHFAQFYEASENPYPYLYALFTSSFNNPRKVLTKAQVAFCEQLLADPKLNGTLKTMVCEKLGDHYRLMNNFKKSADYFAQMGTLNKWQVLGSFNNISGSGFDKEWGALAKATPDAVFKNDVNADVQWYTPPANREDNWFLFDYYFSLNSIIAYAQTFVNSPSAQEVYMRVGTSGSLKIWVNDAQVMSVPEERNCDMDIYISKIKLNAGNNRILVQIGQSEISNANFMIRLTDANGYAVKGLTNTPEYSAYTKSSESASNNLLPFFAEQFLEEKIKSEPDNMLNYLLLGETYLRNDKSYEGTHVLKQAQALASKSSFVSERLSEAYLRAGNRTDYSREKENIKLNDPESLSALRGFYQDAMDSEKYTEAENYCKKIKQLYGESKSTDEMELSLASAQKKNDEVIRLAKIFYTKYPEDFDCTELYATVQEVVEQNSKAALKTVEKYHKQYFNASATNWLVKKYFNTGNYVKGLATFRQHIDRMPYATGLLYNYASILRNMQRYDEALAIINEVKKQSPYLSEVYNTEGYIYKEKQNLTVAKEMFRQAIYYGPTSYDSRLQLRLLENKPEVFDLFPKYNLDSLISAAGTAQDYPEENSLIVLKDSRLVFYPEGAEEKHAILAVKILNQSGIEDWKDYQIGYSSSQKLLLDKYETIKANGQKVQAETDGEGRVVFTNLEVGDVLYLEYRLQDYYAGILSKHFYSQTLLQYSRPSMLNRSAILVPKDKNFTYKITNADIAPTVTNVENMKLYQWVSANQPAIKDEPLISPLVDIAPCLSYSSIPDWQFVSDWYKDLTANKFGENSDYILKATFAEILKGKENVNQLEKARIFYEYILKNITYSNVSFMQGNFIPQKASRTITTRLGDCKDVSTLFVALCREAGIKANLVLISTRENGKNNLLLPSVSFNHCIARLDLDGKIYYLELTNSKLPFGAALSSDLQSPILPIPYKNEKLGSELLTMDMPFRPKNIISRQMKLDISGNDMKLLISSTRTGQMAASTRNAYAELGAEEQLKKMSKSVSSDWSNPVKVSALQFTNLDNLSDSLIYSYNVEAKNALQDVTSGMKIFKMPWTDAITSLSFVSPETRKYPLEFWSYMYRDLEFEQINLTFVQSKQFVEMPKNVKLDCAAASYELNFERKPSGEIIAKRIFTVKKDAVAPEEYEAFRNFMNSVIENDSRQYAIK